MFLQIIKAADDTPTPGEYINVYNNYFSHVRSILSYIKDPNLNIDTNLTVDNLNYVTGLKVENNIIKDIIYQYNELNPSNTDPDRMFWASDNTHNTLIFNNNIIDRSKRFIDVLDQNINGTAGNVSATGNIINTSIAPPIFRDNTFPVDFDWLKVEL